VTALYETPRKPPRQDGTGDEASYRVALALMKSPEADATVDVLMVDDPHIRVIDRGTYLHVWSNRDIEVKLDRISAELGEPVSLSRWLVIMSTYTGRIQTGENWITITDGLPA
jgi:hypothetical protein